MEKEYLLLWIGRDGVRCSAIVPEYSLLFYMSNIENNGGRVIGHIEID